MKVSRIALAAVGAFLVPACSFGGGSEPQRSESSPAAKLDAAAMAVVNVGQSDYLPLYAGSGPSTRLINWGGSCSRENTRRCWPLQGAELPVVCVEPGGQKVRGLNGATSFTWLGVAIPRSRVMAPGYSPELDKQGRAVVFASALWLRPKIDLKSVPSCADFFVTTNDS